MPPNGERRFMIIFEDDKLLCWVMSYRIYFSLKAVFKTVKGNSSRSNLIFYPPLYQLGPFF